MDTTSKDIDTMDTPDEIGYIAIVQVNGLVEDGSTKSSGFADYADALRWVRNEVENAHGGIAHIATSRAVLAMDFGGEPIRHEPQIWWVTSPDGPTQGYVIAND